MKRIDIKYMGLIAGLMMAFSSCADLLNQDIPFLCDTGES